MKVGEAFITFVVVFLAAFIVSAAVSFVWGGLMHGAFVADWETATRMGVIFGLVIPMIQTRERRQHEKHT